MRSKISFPLFFLLITLSFLVTIPNFVQDANATDYDVFTVANASGNIDYTYVWNNYFYVYNNSYVLKYSLDTKTLTDSINLGSNTILTEWIGRGDNIYIKADEIGVIKIIAIDLIAFEEADRINMISLTDWNEDMMNIAFINYDATDYWGWCKINGTQLTLYDNTSMTMSAWQMAIPQQPRFIGLQRGRHVVPTGTVNMYAYIHNGTGVEYDHETCAISSMHSATVYMDWTLTPSIATDGVYEENNAIMCYGYNINAFTDNVGRFEGDYGYKSQYATFLFAGQHCDDSGVFEDTTEMTHVTAKYHYDYDTFDLHFRLFGDDKNDVYFCAFWCDEVPPPFSTYAPPPINIHLSSTMDIDRDNKVGVFSAMKTLDDKGWVNLFIAYVQDDNQTPVAYQVTLGVPSKVGELPATYDPDNCMVFSNIVDRAQYDYEDDSIVAIFTQNADTTLYVCVNLIEAQHIRYGEDTSIVAQLYKCFPSTVAEDNFRIATRWLYESGGDYVPMISDKVEYYENDVWQADYYTNGYGIVEFIYTTSSYPKILSFYMNETGFNDQWLNVTLSDYSPFQADCTITETPIIALDFVDNRGAESLRVKLDLYRFTGELFNDDWFGYSPVMYINGETYLGGVLEDSFLIGELDLDADAHVEFMLLYTQPYSYIIQHQYRTQDQYYATGNFTENAQAEFSYDSSTGNITEGEYVSIPDTPTPSTYYPDEPVNPTTIEEYAVIWTGNTGFFISLGLILAVTIGFAKISPQSAVFGVITIIGLTVGFLGYTGLLPFPIFIIVVLVIVLGITVIFTGLFTGDIRKKRDG